MPEVNVRFNPYRSRWEALIGGDEVGFLDYQVNCGIVEMSQLGVDLASSDDAAAPDVEAALVQAGLEQAREDGLRVVATSPEVEQLLREHPQQK
ncbi:hypothetical protein GA0111570_10395 [Raineyella antarctica]|uniref:N-acetyltransferase domain-containing protein n=1 Tax=Raineyella antarctica TaxID=1577474 RepID=A0A1G6GGA5_9ACTN|nr:hypothetical protein [Raineyella antarctica]SDB80775.1 hypothetical protein GA0111570_10395 [Raineyella antarctica]